MVCLRGESPTHHTKLMKAFKLCTRAAVTGTASLLSLMFATACTEMDVSQKVSPQPSSISSKALQVSQPPSRSEVSYSIVSISDIYELWGRNQVAAIDKYNGKATQITGVVNGIYNDGSGRLEIEDRNDWSGAGITCNIDSSQRSTLGRLSHGDSVTVHGKLKLINGMFDSKEVEVRNCIIGAAQHIPAEFYEGARTGGDEIQGEYYSVAHERKQANNERSKYRQSVIPSGKAFFKSGRTGKEELIGVSLSSRVNTNGHTVYVAEWSDGYESSYVFWSNGHAEIFSKDGTGKTARTAANFKRLDNGSIRIIAETDALTIFPSFNPAAN
jgi:hypothetical protein